MKIEDALKIMEFATEHMILCGYTVKDFKQAIKVLRDGEEPVEVVEDDWWFVCNNCGPVDEINATWHGLVCANCNKKVHDDQIKRRRTYTTNRRLTVETVESVPVFEEIDNE